MHSLKFAADVEWFNPVEMGPPGYPWSTGVSIDEALLNVTGARESEPAVERLLAEFRRLLSDPRVPPEARERLAHHELLARLIKSREARHE